MKSRKMVNDRPKAATYTGWTPPLCQNTGDAEGQSSKQLGTRSDGERPGAPGHRELSGSPLQPLSYPTTAAPSDDKMGLLMKEVV